MGIKTKLAGMLIGALAGVVAAFGLMANMAEASGPMQPTLNEYLFFFDGVHAATESTSTFDLPDLIRINPAPPLPVPPPCLPVYGCLDARAKTSLHRLDLDAAALGETVYLQGGVFEVAFEPPHPYDVVDVVIYAIEGNGTATRLTGANTTITQAPGLTTVIGDVTTLFGIYDTSVTLYMVSGAQGHLYSTSLIGLDHTQIREQLLLMEANGEGSWTSFHDVHIDGITHR